MFNIRPVAPRQTSDGLAGHGVSAQVLERGRRRAARAPRLPPARFSASTATARLAHVEHFICAREVGVRAVVLNIGAMAAVPAENRRRILGVDPDLARQAEQAQSLVQVDGCGRPLLGQASFAFFFFFVGGCRAALSSSRTAPQTGPVLLETSLRPARYC